MLLLLLSALFVLNNGVPMALQPQKNSVDAKHIKKEFNVSNIKNGFDAKSLIKELVDADPAKVKEVVALVEIMLQDAQADLNRLTTASTSANDAYDVAVSNYDAAVVAKTQGVAALNQAEVDAKAAKDVAYGAKTGAQDNLDAEKSRLEGEITSLQQVITILKGLSSDPWITIATEAVTADGGDITRWDQDELKTFTFAGLPSFVTAGNYRVRLEWGSDWVEFTLPPSQSVFSGIGDTVITNVKYSFDSYSGKDALSNAFAADSSGSAIFCSACDGITRPGDSCWAVLPTSDTNRHCGCNSGGWTGNGIYYGGYGAGVTQCGAWGGGFTGPAVNGAQKGGMGSLGLVVKINKSL